MNPPGLWPIRSKLKIAFLNIIINAIEAMEEEKGLLEISN